MQKYIQASKKDKSIQVFTTSMADIQKALAPKVQLSLEQIKELLPSSYRHQLPGFDLKQAAKLPPHCPGIDHHIELIKQDRKNLLIP
jgi:hypothetical protein